MDIFRKLKREDSQNRLWNGTHQEEGNEVDLNSLGRRDSRTDGGKGTSGRRIEWHRRMEKEDTISVQWAQEDVETSYSLLNNNIRRISIFTFRLYDFLVTNFTCRESNIPRHFFCIRIYCCSFLPILIRWSVTDRVLHDQDLSLHCHIQTYPKLNPASYGVGIGLFIPRQ